MKRGTKKKISHEKNIELQRTDERNVFKELMQKEVGKHNLFIENLVMLYVCEDACVQSQTPDGNV
jgi:hypothetical protein